VSSERTEDSGIECEFCGDEFETVGELSKHRIEEHSDRICSKCGDKFSSTPYECNYCGKTFCSEHRLPENHGCEGLENGKNVFEEAANKGNKDIESLADKAERSIEVPSNFRNFPWRKLMPLTGLFVLIWIYLNNSNSELFSGGQLSQIWRMFNETVHIGGVTEIGLTLLIVVTIWSGYSYWLKNLRVVRNVTGLLEKIVAVIIMVVMVDRHIRIGSEIGHYVEWALFLMIVYVELAGTWFLAKLIDNIDLRSDLYCWSLRLMGVITILFGALLFTSFSFVALTTENIMANIYWIGSLCLLGLGAFMEYRSFRREPGIHVW